MRTNIQEFLKNEKLPKFLVSHKKLTSLTKVSKVFPSIGLFNCSETCKFDNSDIAKEAGNNLFWSIYYILSNKIRAKSYVLENKNHNKNPKTIEKINRLNYWRYVVERMPDTYNISSFVKTSDDGKITIKLTYDVLDQQGKIVFRENESIFKVYNKIYNEIKSLHIGKVLPKLEEMKDFKRFSTDNVPMKNYQIVFSSNGNEGLWDIATMSMRGIKSCQSWGGRFKTQLVGSLIDPCVGIIYLTSGKDVDGLGSKMIRRSVVRYTIDSQTQKPIILIDKMYPEYDGKVMESFRAFIENKTNNKIRVVAYPYNNTYIQIKNLYLPPNKIRESLPERTKSYMDTMVATKLPIKEPPLKTNLKNRETRLRNAIRSHSKPISFNSDISCISKNDKIKKSLQKIIVCNDMKYLTDEYFNSIADTIIKEVSKNTFDSSSDYYKQLCFSFLSKKYNKKVIQSFVKRINKYFNLNKNERINSAILTKLLEPAHNQISTGIKLQLKELLTNKSNDLTNDQTVAKI
jgi:hypothetical protein